MFERGEGKAAFRHGPFAAAFEPGVEYPCGKSIAGADPLDYAGHVNLVGLVCGGAAVDARGDAVVIGGDEVPCG